MHSRKNRGVPSRVVVRGILTTVVLSSGLGYSTSGICREPWEIEPPPPIMPERNREEVIEGGFAASILFASFGIGLGAAAATVDAESERVRGEPCRSCPGGFNEMQRDMAFLANGAVLAFVAAGIAGVGTALYAISSEDDEESARSEKKKYPSPKAEVRVQGGLLGVRVIF